MKRIVPSPQIIPSSRRFFIIQQHPAVFISAVLSSVVSQAEIHHGEIAFSSKPGLLLLHFRISMTAEHELKCGKMLMELVVLLFGVFLYWVHYRGLKSFRLNAPKQTLKQTSREFIKVLPNSTHTETDLVFHSFTREWML